MSHTPGPWRVKEGLDRDTGEIATYVYGGLASIAECYGPDSIDNARLIVASPDMQKALQEIANHHEEQRELWESEENADADLFPPGGRWPRRIREHGRCHRRSRRCSHRRSHRAPCEV